jgi:hypothetical protein
MLRGVRNLTDGPVERRLISLRRLRRPRYLAHILQSRVMHLSLSRLRLKVVQRSDVPTHPPILPRVYQSNRPNSQGDSEGRASRSGAVAAWTAAGASQGVR